jgi:hypothetical protein
MFVCLIKNNMHCPFFADFWPGAWSIGVAIELIIDAIKTFINNECSSRPGALYLPFNREYIKKDRHHEYNFEATDNRL